MTVDEITKEWLIEQNRNLKKSSSDIARELGTTSAVIKNRFKKFHLHIKRYYENSIFE